MDKKQSQCSSKTILIFHNRNVLITRWAKLCSRHYEKCKSHKKKRRRLVNTYKYTEFSHLYHKLEGIPVKPGSQYHDEPVNIPMGSGYCVICGKKTRWMCWGYCMDLKGSFPVCSISTRNCFEQMHQIRNQI